MLQKIDSDELTLVSSSSAGSEGTLFLPESSSSSSSFNFNFNDFNCNRSRRRRRPSSSHCHLLSLPIEIRLKIYRYLCISEHSNRTSHPRLWRPRTGSSSSSSSSSDPGVGGGGGSGSWGGAKIGYFERGSGVIPLLCLCRQIHDEAAVILYGENVFAFHVSELSQGPISFFSWLAPRYVRLLRRVHIRSGFGVDTYDDDRDPVDCWMAQSVTTTTTTTTNKHNKLTVSELIDYRIVKNLALSVAIVKQAWPAEEYTVCINKIDTLDYSEQDDEEEGTCKRTKVVDWPIGSYHLWKMFFADAPAGSFEPEFRRADLTRRRKKKHKNPNQDTWSSSTARFYS